VRKRSGIACRIRKRKKGTLSVEKRSVQTRGGQRGGSGRKRDSEVAGKCAVRRGREGSVAGLIVKAEGYGGETPSCKTENGGYLS